ncbi:MAG: hypothetical protein AAGF12_20390 [Myxococcota bacterium]
MKNIGLVMVTLGVAVCAAYGARLSPEMRDAMIESAPIQLLAGPESEAKGAYCAARAEAIESGASFEEFSKACPDPDPPETDTPEEDPATVRAEPPDTLEEHRAAQRALVEAIRGEEDPSEALPTEVADKLSTYIEEAEKLIDARARAAMVVRPDPGTRVSTWFGDNGVFFVLGLLVLIAGAVMARIAVKKESLGEGGSSEDGAADFGKVLGELAAAVKELSESMKSTTNPKAAQFDEAKTKIEEVQLEKFEPLIAAKNRVQARYGMGGFAEIFGPLSSAERRVNRAWAALVDKHYPEARTSIAGASDNLGEAVQALEARMKSH